jgi:predicted small secreted protein
MRRTLLAVVAAVVVAMVVAACGGGGGSSAGGGGGDLDAAGVADATSARLAKVESATVDLDFTGSTAATEQGGERPALGFRLQGPYSLEGDGPLPVASLTYIERRGTAEERSTFVSTGKAAYVRTGDDTYRLPPERTAGLTLGRKGGGVRGLRLGSWFVAPKLTRDGDDDVVTGRVRPDVAFADLAALASRLGVSEHGELDALAQQDRAQLERLVSSSSLRLMTSHDDHVLRSLTLRVDLSSEAKGGAAGSPLASLGSARIDLRLALSHVGDDVHVEAPAGAKPLP